MSVRIEFPIDLEPDIRRKVSNLDEVAKEALALELYRRGLITHHRLSQILGMDRFALEEVLKQHGIFYDQTVDDVLQESDSLRKSRESC